MGEYILVDGQPCKIGTCQDLYYVTFDRLRELVASGAGFAPNNLPPADYLKEDHGWRYRFPFPDENSEAWPEDYDRGVMVPWPGGVVVEGDHDPVWVPVPAIGQDYVYTVIAKVVCPQDPEADPSLYDRPGETRYLQVTQQKQIEGKLWTVVRCPYCGQAWRLPPEQGLRLAAAISEAYEQGSDAARRFYQELARRIVAGYAQEVGNV